MMSGMTSGGMMSGMMAGGIESMVLAGLLSVALLVLLVLGAVLLVLGAVWLARHLRSLGSGGSNEALDIVRREYASGRINRDEYLERSGYLASSPS